MPSLHNLFILQGGDLLECHVTGLAVLLVHMISSQCPYQQLRVTGPRLPACADHHHVKVFLV